MQFYKWHTHEKHKNKKWDYIEENTKLNNYRNKENTRTPKKKRWRLELERFSKKAIIWYRMSINIVVKSKVDLDGTSRTSYVIL